MIFWWIGGGVLTGWALLNASVAELLAGRRDSLVVQSSILLLKPLSAGVDPESLIRAGKTGVLALYAYFGVLGVLAYLIFGRNGKQ